MTPQEFGQYWGATYPQCPPVGYLLRQQYEHRWFRIHTLPAAQRYAATEEEYQEILRRHNAVLSDTLGNGQPFVLVSPQYSEAATPIPSHPQGAQALAGRTSQPFLSALIADDFTPMYWHFFMDELRWEPHMADPLLRLVATDAVRNVLFVSVERHSVYAPYDGGADIVLPSVPARDALRQCYVSWLSAHPLGL